MKEVEPPVLTNREKAVMLGIFPALYCIALITQNPDMIYLNPAIIVGELLMIGVVTTAPKQPPVKKDLPNIPPTTSNT